MCLQNLMKFHQRFLKLLRKQNVTDTRTHTRSEGRTDVKTVYPPTNTVCGGYKNVHKDILFIILEKSSSAVHENIHEDKNAEINEKKAISNAYLIPPHSNGQ